MKKNITVLGCLFAFIFVSHGQQKPHFSQYMINKFMINPAIAGTDDYLEAVLSYRNQWSGLDDNPETGYFTFQGASHHYGTSTGRVRNTHNSWHSFGGTFISDKTGPTKRTYSNLTYGHNISLGKKTRLSMGTRVGVVSYKVSDGFDVRDDNDLTLAEKSYLVPDLSLGLFLYSKESYYLSFSVDQLLSSNILENETFDYSGDGTKLHWHYYLSGGVIVPHSPYVKTALTTMVKYVYPAVASIDLSFRTIIKDTYWVGANYRVADSFSLLLGYVWQNNIEIGYSYDITHSKLQSYNSGTHEILVGLRLPFKRNVDCPSSFW